MIKLVSYVRVADNEDTATYGGHYELQVQTADGWKVMRRVPVSGTDRGDAMWSPATDGAVKFILNFLDLDPLAQCQTHEVLDDVHTAEDAALAVLSSWADGDWTFTNEDGELHVRQDHDRREVMTTQAERELMVMSLKFYCHLKAIDLPAKLLEKLA